MLNKQELLADLAHCYGTEGYTRHMGGLLLTDGLMTLCAGADCFWLADIVGSIMPMIRRRGEEFVHITLTVDKKVGLFIATDGGKNGRKPHEIYRQAIEYTDFPLDKIELFLQNNVLMLPSEN